MTFTSDERREIAARLRDEAGGFRRLEKVWGHEPTIDLGDVPAVFQDVAHFAGLDGTVRTCVLFDRLADLIDPPEITEDTSDGILNARTTGELVRCGECIHFERCTMYADCSRCEYDGKLSTHCPLSPCFPDTDKLDEIVDAAGQADDICQYFYMHHLSPDSVAADCYPKVGYPESYAYHCELLGEKPPIVGMNAGILCCANCQYLIENKGYYDCGNIANLSNSHDNLIHLGFVASGSEFLTHLGCLDFVKKSEN